MALLCLLFAVSCHRATVPDGRAPAASFEPASLIPAGALAIGYLDAPTLLSRPALRDDSGLVQPLIEKVRVEFGIDPALVREATLFSAPGTGGAGAGEGFAGGFTLGLGAIIPGSLRGSPGLATVGPPTVQGGFQVYPLGRGARVMFLERATVIADEQSLKAVLDVASQKRPSLPKTDDLWKLLGGLGAQPFRIAVRLAGFKVLLDKLPIPAELRTISAFALGLDVIEAEAQIRLGLPAEDPPVLAARLEGMVKSLADQLRRSSFLRMFGDLLGSVQVQPAAGQVSVQARIPISIARALLPPLLSAWRLR
jgi:hypothetical protein